MALFEEGSFGHVEGDPKSEKAVTSVLRIWCVVDRAS